MTNLAFRHWLVLAAAAMLALALPQAAFAHAQLLATAPPTGAVVAEPPDSLALTFNEPVTPIVISLVTPAGEQRDLLDATHGGETVGITLPEDLGTGTYVLSWRVVSIDAHPIGGSLIFSIGTATETAVPMENLGSRATALALLASKIVLFVTLFLGVGGAVFGLATPLPPPARNVSVLASALGLVAAPLTIGLNGLDALGGTLDGLFTDAAWQTGLVSTYGTTGCVLLAAFAVSIIALTQPAARLLAILAWAIAGIGLSLSGHAGAADPQWLTRPAVAIHIAGLLFWLGALVPLFVLLSNPGETSNFGLKRFSRFAPIAVAPILASGIILAIIQLGPIGPAWITGYGAILGAKLLLVAALLGLALHNRLRLTTPTLAGEHKPRFTLRRSILAEIVIVLAILGLASGWRFTPPPRAMALAPPTASVSIPLFAHAMDDAVMADITLTPGSTGPVDIDIFLVDIAGQPIEPMAVDLTLAAPALGIEPIKVGATLRDGLWVIEDQIVPIAGTWELTLDIRLDRFNLRRIGADIDIL